MTDKNRGFDPSRRRLLTAVPAIATLAACERSTPAPTALSESGTASLPAFAGLPDPQSCGIDHIVVVMMENRSFDHMLGWVPGADGQQAGLQFLNTQGEPRTTFRLSQDPGYGYQGCNLADPDHSYDGGRLEFNNGRMDGFLLPVGTASSPETGANPADKFPIGYYTADDLPFYRGCAENFTICDRYFSGILSATYPNRIYMHAGQTDRNENSSNTSTLETVWDRLAAKGLTGVYYAADIPFTAIWGKTYLNITRPFDAFLADAKAGRLADVTYIDPAFGGEGQGVSKDDHPHADVRDGQDFLNTIYNALLGSPQWDRTLLIINYDEWGGFYDHVAPPLAPVSDDERGKIGPKGNDGRLGFRVPCVLIGPRVRKAHVEHQQLDPNAILNFICWRFGLDGLGVRAATSGNLAYTLDFATPLRGDKPVFSVPSGPFAKPCMSQISPVPLPGTPLSSLDPVQRTYAQHRLEMDALLNLALRNGFAIGPGFDQSP